MTRAWLTCAEHVPPGLPDPAVRPDRSGGRAGTDGDALGLFDLFVVIATAPWFLLPGAQAGQFVVVLRLARRARLAMATEAGHRLLKRLGWVAAVAGGIVVVGSLVAYHAEHPTNPGFATVGDAVWWGIVTLTTVGYEGIVPNTATGRWAAVIIMITGLAVLGTLAGSLASFFRLGNGRSSASELPGAVGKRPDAPPLDPAGDGLSALRNHSAASPVG